MKRIVAACDALLETIQDDTPQGGHLRPVPQLLWGLAAQLAPDDHNAAIIDRQADHALEDAFSGGLMLRAAVERLHALARLLGRMAAQKYLARSGEATQPRSRNDQALLSSRRPADHR